MRKRLSISLSPSIFLSLSVSSLPLSLSLSLALSLYSFSLLFIRLPSLFLSPVSMSFLSPCLSGFVASTASVCLYLMSILVFLSTSFSVTMYVYVYFSSWLNNSTLLFHIPLPLHLLLFPLSLIFIPPSPTQPAIGGIQPWWGRRGRCAVAHGANVDDNDSIDFAFVDCAAAPAAGPKPANQRSGLAVWCSGGGEACSPAFGRRQTD